MLRAILVFYLFRLFLTKSEQHLTLLIGSVRRDRSASSLLAQFVCTLQALDRVASLAAHSLRQEETKPQSLECTNRQISSSCEFHTILRDLSHNENRTLIDCLIYRLENWYSQERSLQSCSVGRITGTIFDGHTVPPNSEKQQHLLV